MYMPRFLVTQEVYDAASPSERQKYNYVVDEEILTLPKTFNIPIQEGFYSPRLPESYPPKDLT